MLKKAYLTLIPMLIMILSACSDNWTESGKNMVVGHCALVGKIPIKNGNIAEKNIQRLRCCRDKILSTYSEKEFINSSNNSRFMITMQSLNNCK